MSADSVQEPFKIDPSDKDTPDFSAWWAAQSAWAKELPNRHSDVVPTLRGQLFQAPFLVNGGSSALPEEFSQHQKCISLDFCRGYLLISRTTKSASLLNSMPKLKAYMWGGWSGSTQAVVQLGSLLCCNIDTDVQGLGCHLEIQSVDVFWDGIIVWKLQQNSSGWLRERASMEKETFPTITIICVFLEACRPKGWRLSRTAVWQGNSTRSGVRWGLVLQRFGAGLSSWQF